MYAAADAVPASVPAFLGKLWILVEDAANNDLIGWDSVSLLEMWYFISHVIIEWGL